MAVDPSSLQIVVYPAPVLRQVADPIGAVTDEVREIASRMIELMREADGIGLAAPQVGLRWRMFVAEVPPGEERVAEGDEPSASLGPQVFINPKIVDPVGELEAMEEGCLSLPDIAGEVRRPPVVSIEALGLDGAPVRLRASGLLARCWQHELDHLDGVLIIDRMTQMSRIKNRSAVKRMEKEARV